MAEYIVNSPGSTLLNFPSNIQVGDKLIFNVTNTRNTGTPLQFPFPKTGVWQIEASGASGAQGNLGSRTPPAPTPGFAAKITGSLFLTQGAGMKLVVGQKGEVARASGTSSDRTSGPSGGATFIYIEGELAVVAGGGQGTNDYGYQGTRRDGGNALISDYAYPNHTPSGMLNVLEQQIRNNNFNGQTYSRSDVAYGGYGGGGSTDDANPATAGYSYIQSGTQQLAVSYFRTSGATLEQVVPADITVGQHGQITFTFIQEVKNFKFGEADNGLATDLGLTVKGRTDNPLLEVKETASDIEVAMDSDVVEKMRDILGIGNKPVKRYWVDPDYSGDTVDGSQFSPFKSWADFLTAKGTEQGLIVHLQNTDSEDIVVFNKKNWTITSGLATKDAGRVNVNSVAITGTSEGIYTLGLVINTTYYDTSSVGNNYLRYCTVKGLTSIGSQGYVDLELSSFEGNVEVHGSTVDVLNSQFEDNSVLSVDGAASMVIVTSSRNVSIQKSAGTLLIMGSTNLAPNSTLGIFSLVSTGGAVMIEDGMSLNPDGTLAPVSITGTFGLGKLLFETATSILTGAELQNSLHSRQVIDTQAFTNITPASSRLSDILKAIDDKLA